MDKTRQPTISSHAKQDLGLSVDKELNLQLSSCSTIKNPSHILFNWISVQEQDDMINSRSMPTQDHIVNSYLNG